MKSRGERHGQEEGGFTLLEVMVAVGIIAIVLGAIFRLHSQTVDLTGAARFHNTAPLLAQKVLAEFEARPPADRISGSGNFEPDFPGYTWRITVDDVISEYLGQIAEDLKKITVEVASEAEGTTFTVTTYRFARG